MSRLRVVAFRRKARIGTFMRAMRIMDKDAYGLDTRMTSGGTCLYGSATPVVCKPTAQ